MTPDKRMLRLIDLLIFEKKIRYFSDFCQSIGMKNQTLTKIKNGSQHFTVLQVQSACNVYNVNANWIFGIQDNVYNEKNSIKIREV